jgi:hypothetical protein
VPYIAVVGHIDPATVSIELPVVGTDLVGQLRIDGARAFVGVGIVIAGAVDGVPLIDPAIEVVAGESVEGHRLVGNIAGVDFYKHSTADQHRSTAADDLCHASVGNDLGATLGIDVDPEVSVTDQIDGSGGRVDPELFIFLQRGRDLDGPLSQLQYCIVGKIGVWIGECQEGYLASIVDSDKAAAGKLCLGPLVVSGDDCVSREDRGVDKRFLDRLAIVIGGCPQDGHSVFLVLNTAEVADLVIVDVG